MGKRIFVLFVVALTGMLLVPAVAFGANLVNEYGMHYAGQGACVGCHTDYDSGSTDGSRPRASRRGACRVDGVPGCRRLAGGRRRGPVAVPQRRHLSLRP